MALTALRIVAMLVRIDHCKYCWFIAVPFLPATLNDITTELIQTTQPPIGHDVIVTSRHRDDSDADDRFPLASDNFYEWVDGSLRSVDQQWLLDRYLWLRSYNSTQYGVINNNTDNDDDSFQKEDGYIGWLLATKAISQIIASPFIGIIVNRQVWRDTLLVDISIDSDGPSGNIV